MIFKWFSTTEVNSFGKELAAFVLLQLKGSLHKRDPKFAAAAGKALNAAAQRVAAFKARERMNVYKKAKLANAFLWALKDGGCPDDYANELTDWLTLQL